MGSHIKYDPVPPYELDDTASTQAQLTEDNLTIDETSTIGPDFTTTNIDIERDATERPRFGPFDSDDCLKCRAGKLTERDRCDYALKFVLFSVLGFCAATWIIAHYASLGHRGKD